MNKIQLTKGKYALVDDADFKWLNQWKWHFDGQYAARKSPKKIYMHRLINLTPDSFETDHINRDKLDNRRSNLRSTMRSQNAFNVGLRPNNTSGFIGVSWTANRWEAYIWKDGFKIYLGRFKDKYEALKARKKAEEQYHGL